MYKLTCICIFLFWFFAAGGAEVSAQTGSTPAPVTQTPSIEDKTKGMQRFDGFFPVYWDDSKGQLWLEIPRLDADFLLITGLAAGVGSNDIGLDRGQTGDSAVVYFQRIGPKVLLVRRNEIFRSTSTSFAERRSVEESFAKSVLAAFPIDAKSGDRVLVNATNFFIRDGHNAARALRPGNYSLDRDRSAMYMPRTKAFPRNTEVESLLTFSRGNSGDGGSVRNSPAQGPEQIGRGGGRASLPSDGLFSGTVASVAPDAQSVTLREHYSLVQLPDAGYKPRAFDPRGGFINTEYVDYSVPLSESLVQRFIIRHRLIKKDPNAAISEPVEPIRYYVDPGAPEDIRRALVEGASWWNSAFEGAGFRNAFRVEVLPADVDPMDIRYNVINWVHRSTRGWSYGGSVIDPRTGEIIRGVVTLGSLRDRQDYLIFEGLLSPYTTGKEKPDILYQTAIARIRQLSAHEVGHTLGLMHNYYDSTRGWISVMDYPHPQEKLNDDGTIDLSGAYPKSIGDWDKVAIDYGYRQFANDADEKPALAAILDKAWTQDLRYFTNQDLGTHPRVDQWSNGVNQADELVRIMKVRRAALERMGENTVREGAPLATIEEALVPIFMYHRYAVESAAASLGGVDYIYAIRGDKRIPLKQEPAENQRKSLEALVNTLRPSELTVPGRVLAAIPPRPPGYHLHRELFPRTTGGAFDPLSPASVAADVTIGFVLQLDRAARLVSQHAVIPALPGLEEVIDRLVTATFDAPTASPYEAEVRRTGETVLVDRLIWLVTGSPNAQVRAIATAKLNGVAARGKTGEASGKKGDSAHLRMLTADITRFLNRPSEEYQAIVAPDAPPGAPIGGDGGYDWLRRPPYRAESRRAQPESMRGGMSSIQ